MYAYVLIFFRIITIMLLLLFSVLFIMGKRPIGELPVFDFLTIIVIGAIVGADIADPHIKHLPTAFAVVVLAAFQRFISIATKKSKRIRKLITFEPTIVIQEGRLLYKNIKRINYTLDDILMLLREKEINDISQIYFGIIEANGNLSIMRKPEYEGLTLKDLNIAEDEKEIYLTVILDGKFQENNLTALGLSKEEVLKKIALQGCARPSEVFYASINRNGSINVSPYRDNLQ